MGHYIWAIANPDGTFLHVYESETFEPGPGYPYQHPFGDVDLEADLKIVELTGDIEEIKAAAEANEISPASEILRNRRTDLAHPDKAKPIMEKGML